MILTEDPKKMRLAVPTKNGRIFVDEKNILYCKAEGSYTTLYLVDSEAILITRGLRKVHEAITPGVFVRIHHSYIVNIYHIVNFSVNRKNCVTLTDGTILSVSRNRKKSFFEKYKVI